MKSMFDRYIDRVLVYANKPEPESAAIRQELLDHLTQKREELIATGFSAEDAALEALRRHGSPKVVGYGLRGGFPWVDIRAHGTARGVIAIGPKAIGIFAFGSGAVGVFACGGLAVGLFSAGGLSLGLFAWGGMAIGGLANGGMAAGLVAVGGLALGAVAAGGLAMGLWVPHTFGPTAEIISHYTPKTVPPLLKSLDYLLTRSFYIEQYFAVIMPAYMLAIFTFSYLLRREQKRVSKEDDWLVEEA